MKAIESNTEDFGLVSVLPDSINILSENLFKNELYLVANTQFDLNFYTTCKKAVPMIFREEGSATRQAMEHFLNTQHIHYQTKVTLQSNEAVKQAIIAGMRCSLMPLIGIHQELKNQRLKIIPHNKLPLITQWQFIWNNHKQLSPVAKAFLTHIQENKSQIHENFT